MELTSKKKQFLKGKAHKLQPFVTIGKNGMTTSVLKEIDRTLDHHELIKVKVVEEDRDIFCTMVNSIAEETEATLIGALGRIAILYRLNPENNRFKI